jgi:hypothetical protein
MPLTHEFVKPAGIKAAIILIEGGGNLKISNFH